ncbi:MAG: hypothetical protein JWM58_83 [Rhizobium sp.]|nr:hypothetical protein [Rhizobium sp.]
MTYSEIGRRIYEEHGASKPFLPLQPEDLVRTQRDAYDVQDHYVRLINDQGRGIGYKIGLTSARMQKMCSIDSPVAGVVFADRVFQSGVHLKRHQFGRLGVEFEIGVRIGRDLDASEGPFTRETIEAAVDGVCAAVEVVDDRSADYSLLNALSLIADNSWNAGIILGEWRHEWPALEDLKGSVSLDGTEIDSGYGRDVLGHPFTPLAWLANHLVERGGGLKAGDIVLTGSLVTTKFPKESGSFHYTLDGLGTVDFEVED